MKVKFLSPVNAGSEQHQVGDTADLPNAQARELIACGAAESFDPAAAKAAAKAEAEAQALAAAKAAAKAEAEAQALAAAEADAKAKAEQAAAELAAKARG